MPKNNILQTDRLILRRMQNSDITALLDLWSNPRVTKYLGGPRDREKLKIDLVQDAKNPDANQYDLWPLIEKSSAEVIGHCGILDKDVDGKEEFEIIYVLKPSAWGKGFATEIGLGIVKLAFEEYKINRLIALIEPENAPSEQVASKIGFSFEKKVFRPGGGVRYIYAIEQIFDR